jgi:hypothetical protein
MWMHITLLFATMFEEIINFLLKGREEKQSTKKKVDCV